jgi:hypothetical protein
MKTNESRKAMVERVNVAFAKHSTLVSWPELDGERLVKDAEVVAAVKGALEADYVSALYEVCAKGEPIGRIGNKLVGKRIVEDAPKPSGKTMKIGTGESV